MTICTKCKINKEPHEFKQNHRKKNGLASWCRVCEYQGDSVREKAKTKKNRQPKQVYVDWGGTPSLLGIAMGIVPIQHDKINPRRPFITHYNDSQRSARGRS